MVGGVFAEHIDEVLLVVRVCDGIFDIYSPDGALEREEEECLTGAANRYVVDTPLSVSILLILAPFSKQRLIVGSCVESLDLQGVV